MSDIEEARLAVEAARRTGLPVLVSFAFDSGKNKDRTMMGATPEAVAAAMAEAGADAVGANCGVGVELSVPICQRLHAACGLPIWIKPNAGLPTIEGRPFTTPRRPSTSLRISRHSPRQALPSSAVVADRRRSSFARWLPRVMQQS